MKRSKVIFAFIIVFLLIQVFCGLLAFCVWPAPFVVVVLFGFDVYTVYVLVRTMRDLIKEARKRLEEKDEKAD